MFMKVYLDACCINRPFDDQTQDRIRLEAEAVLLILAQVEKKRVEWVSSEVVEFEIDEMPDRDRWHRVSLLTRSAKRVVRLDVRLVARGDELTRLGFGALDALHLACAERAKVAAFLTTDDRLLRLASRESDKLRVRVVDPVTWIRGGEA